MSKIISGYFISWIAAILLGSLGIAGCAQPSVRNLRERPHEVLSFNVPADCGTVYQRIVLRARRQYAFTGAPKHQLGINARLSPDDQSATVTLWDSGGIGIRYLLVAEIRAADSTHAKIDLYVARKRDGQEARLWAGWADTPLEN